MKFKNGEFYRHTKFTDVMVYVIQGKDQGEEGYHLWIRWFLTSGLDMGIQEWARVTRMEAINWYWVPHPEVGEENFNGH